MMKLRDLAIQESIGFIDENLNVVKHDKTCDHVFSERDLDMFHGWDDEVFRLVADNQSSGAYNVVINMVGSGCYEADFNGDDTEIVVIIVLNSRNYLYLVEDAITLTRLIMNLSKINHTFLVDTITVE